MPAVSNNTSRDVIKVSEEGEEKKEEKSFSYNYFLNRKTLGNFSSSVIFLLCAPFLFLFSTLKTFFRSTPNVADWVREVPITWWNLGIVIVTLGYFLPQTMTYPLFAICRLVLGTLYPAYASYKAVRTKNVREYVKWMMYWIVFAFFTCFETVGDIFIGLWFPFYYELKIIFLIWLISPVSRGSLGSSMLYRKLVHPNLMKREDEIDLLLNRLQEQSYNAVIRYGSRAFQYVTNLVMTTAIRAPEYMAMLMAQRAAARHNNDQVDFRGDAVDGGQQQRRIVLQEEHQPNLRIRTESVQKSAYSSSEPAGASRFREITSMNAVVDDEHMDFEEDYESFDSFKIELDNDPDNDPDIVNQAGPSTKTTKKNKSVSLKSNFLVSSDGEDIVEVTRVVNSKKKVVGKKKASGANKAPSDKNKRNNQLKNDDFAFSSDSDYESNQKPKSNTTNQKRTRSTRAAKTKAEVAIHESSSGEKDKKK